MGKKRRTKRNGWKQENPAFDALELARGLTKAGFPPRSISVRLYGPTECVPGRHVVIAATFPPVCPTVRVRAERVGVRLGLLTEGGGTRLGRKGKRVVPVESDTSWLLMPANVRREFERQA